MIRLSMFISGMECCFSGGLGLLVEGAAVTLVGEGWGWSIVDIMFALCDLDVICCMCCSGLQGCGSG
jgi:hypothetical protein